MPDHLALIVHPGPAEVAGGEKETTRFDDIQGYPQTGAKPHQRSGILWNVRLVERQAQDRPLNGPKTRAEKAFSAASCRKTLEIRLSILPRGRARFGLFPQPGLAFPSRQFSLPPVFRFRQLRR